MRTQIAQKFSLAGLMVRPLVLPSWHPRRCIHFVEYGLEVSSDFGKPLWYSSSAWDRVSMRNPVHRSHAVQLQTHGFR